jgi:hypothetical protein
MTPPSRQRRTTPWVAVALGCMVAVGAIALGYPKQVAHPLLGGEWQCSQTALLTSCTRPGPAHNP